MKKVHNTQVATYSSTAHDILARGTNDKEAQIIVAGTLAAQADHGDCGFTVEQLDHVERVCNERGWYVELRTGGITGLTFSTNLRGEAYILALIDLAESIGAVAGDFGGVTRIKSTADAAEKRYNSGWIYRRDGTSFTQDKVDGEFDFFAGRLV